MTATNLGLSRRSRGLPRDRRKRGVPPPVKCQICKAATVPGLDLGHQPVGDLLLVGSQLNQSETMYPMRLYHCAECGLTQLGYIVNPRIVYKHFPFVSGTTQTATKHLQSLPRQLVEMGAASPQTLAVDIGSNDGTLLKGYLPYGVKFLGVDPAGEAGRIAAAEGVPTLHAFFNEETAEHIISEYGRSGAITACGVFAHIADLTGVMRGVKKLLAKRGVFATDSQYWLDMVLAGHYDNMFHQHLRYYAMKPLIRLFHDYGMDVFDVERSGVYGGSIRVFSCHAGDYPISKRVSDLVALEEQEHLYEEATYLGFAKKIEQRRRRFFDEVYQLAAAGKKIIGIGAPAKASTVCNYCRLGPDLVEYITEVNPLRIGKYLPGVHIPIVPEDTVFTDGQPADAAILFAWNYYDEIMPKLRQRGFAGQVLLP